jgi:hypothetical protein
MFARNAGEGSECMLVGTVDLYTSLSDAKDYRQRQLNPYCLAMPGV